MMSQHIPFFALDDTPASQSKNFGGAFSVFTLKGFECACNSTRPCQVNKL